jgi:hypothetical protein
MLSTLMLLLGSSRVASAQAGLTALSVSGGPVSLIVNTALAGTEPTAAVYSTASYTVTAKKTAGVKKIVGSINAPMPANTTLTIELVAVSGATSLGPVALDMTPRDLEINISKENATNAGIIYTFTATVAAGVIPAQSRIVTLTLVNYP